MENAWGIVGIGIAHFDLEQGQILEEFYPAMSNLAAPAQRVVACLSLPHSTSGSQYENDIQYFFRYRPNTQETLFRANGQYSESDFQYGFVLFRQRRDATLQRGFYQKSVVLITTVPLVHVYEKVVRLIGNSFFLEGASIFPSIFQDFSLWPPPLEGMTMKLKVGTQEIRCTVPSLDAPKDQIYPLTKGSSPKLETKKSLGESPTLDDIFHSTLDGDQCLFQTIGLFSSFPRMISSLWHLWQLAILGESVLILGPDAYACSHAALAFVSLIQPLQFAGDYRPYFTIFDPDFQQISMCHDSKEGRELPPTVIGATNPFFCKSLHLFPNLVVLDGGSSSSNSPRRKKVNSKTSGSPDEMMARSPKSENAKKLRKTTPLDTIEDLEENTARMYTRRSCYVRPDVNILKRLLTLKTSVPTDGIENDDTRDAHISINNALLRQHFNQLTQIFLAPFEQYFQIWHGNRSAASNPYSSVHDIMKTFTKKAFLQFLDSSGVDPMFRTWKWRKLYARFLESRHFILWFDRRREACRNGLYHLLSEMRRNCAIESLFRDIKGKRRSQKELVLLQTQIERAIEIEMDRKSLDQSLVEIMQMHLQQVYAQIESLR